MFCVGGDESLWQEKHFLCFLHNLMSLQVTSWCSIWSSSVRVRGRGFRCGEWRTWSWFLFLRVCTEGSTAETLTWFSTALRIAEEACSTTCTTGKVLHPVLILHYTCTNDKIYWHWIQKYFLKTFLWHRSSLFLKYYKSVNKFRMLFGNVLIFGRLRKTLSFRGSTQLT